MWLSKMAIKRNNMEVDTIQNQKSKKALEQLFKDSDLSGVLVRQKKMRLKRKENVQNLINKYKRHQELRETKEKLDQIRASQPKEAEPPIKEEKSSHSFGSEEEVNSYEETTLQGDISPVRLQA